MIVEDDLYQDIRILGETIHHGRRNDEHRYNTIKPFLQRYNKDYTFSVLDFGANYGYFSWRITEDFPKAEITMIDGRKMLELIYNINSSGGYTGNIELISEWFTLEKLKEHAKNHHYDLILLFSVLHHFPDDEIPEAVNIFKKMGDTLLIETDYPDTPNFKDNQEIVHKNLEDKNPIQINLWSEHDRPIYYVNDEETSINGVVRSGGGEAQKNIPYPNYAFKWFRRKKYPGTLNITLEKGIEYDPIVRIGVYALMRVYINGFPCLALRDVNLNLPKTFLEVISPLYLRGLFDLHDDDNIIVSFDKNMVRVV